MATIAGSKRGKKSASAGAESGLPPRRRRRWWFTATVLIGLPALLWFAPTIVALPPVLNSVVALSTSDFKGSITVSSASLGWLSPIVIRDVEVNDAEGKPIAKVPTVSSGNSLLEMLTSPRELGTFTIDHPQLHLQWHEQTSNVEEALAKLLAPRDEAPSPRGMTLSITDAVVDIDDLTTGRQWQLDRFSCEVTLSSSAAQMIDVTADGHLAGNAAGEFSLHLKMAPGTKQAADASDKNTNPLADTTGDVAVVSRSLPLELFEPLMRRSVTRSELAGTLDADLKGEWDNSAAQPRATLSGQIGASQLLLVGPWSGEDRLRIEKINVPCSVTRTGPRLEIHQCDLTTDVGHLSCAGAIDNLDTLGPPSLATLWSALPHTTAEIKGSLDLARISRLLPATLRVRDGLQIEEGAINLDLTAGPQSGHWGCAGHVETTRIVAVEAGHQLTWDHPLSLTIAGHDTPQGPVIEQLKGETDFLKFEGSGTPDLFGMTANFELARMVEQLERFVDLGPLRVAGDGWARLTWKCAADSTIEAGGELQATNLVLARPGRPVWNDPRLVISTSIKGNLDGRRLKGLDAASAQVASGADEFTVALIAPVADISNPQTACSFEAHLHGDLQRWFARVEPWLNLPAGWDISGEVDAVSNVHYAPDSIAVDKGQADFTKLHAWGPTLFIDEPHLRATGTCKLELASGALQIADASLSAGDIAASIKNASLNLLRPTAAQRIEQAELQGNLGTLARWTQDPRVPTNLQVNGSIDCKLHADLSSAAPSLDMNTTIDDLIVTPHTGSPWREKQMIVGASASYDLPTDVLQIGRLEIKSDAVQLSATGRVEQWSKDRVLSISGKTDYDLEKITILLQSYGQGEIRLVGRESRTFSLAGTVGSAHLNVGPPALTAAMHPGAVPGAVAMQDPYAMLAGLDGKAGFGWQSASLFGFDAAAGDLQATLSKGTLQVAPARLSVSGGTLLVAPTARLTPGPAELRMPAGPLIERVRVTPQMCERWLKYALPPLFKAPKVDGSFSAELSGCIVPLAQPAAADIAGQVTIHSLDLEPGPFMQEMSVILGKSSSARLAQESKVDFKVVQGRVYHRGLKLQFPEMTIETYGSVGFDHTLAIIARFGMPPIWVRQGAVPDALKNQALELPIGGTLEKPQIDHQKLAQLQAQFVRDAVQNGITNEVQKGLDRLLSPFEPKK